jgi:hypothetical protein
MKPFILQYSQSTKRSAEEKFIPQKYSTKLEQVLLHLSNDKKNLLLVNQGTGSLMTKASGDPTQDEPTDR